MEIAIKVRTSFSCVSSWKHHSNRMILIKIATTAEVSGQTSMPKRNPNVLELKVQKKKKQVSERTFQTKCLDIYFYNINVYMYTVLYLNKWSSIMAVECGVWLKKKIRLHFFFINENSQRFWWNAFIRMCLLALALSLS